MKKNIGLGVGVTFCALFFQACDKAESVDELNQVVSNNKVQGFFSENKSVAIPVSVQSEDYLLFLQQLSDDIVEDSAVAADFIRDKNGYCQKKGFGNLNVDMDSGLLNLILALSNRDLCEAAKDDDVKGFLSICNRKGLLNPQAILRDPYVKEVVDFYQKHSGINRLGLDNNIMLLSPPQGEPPQFSGVYGCLVAVVAAVAVEAFVVVGTTVWVTHVKGQNPPPPAGRPTSLLQLWNLKSSKTSSNVLTEQMVYVAMDIIRKNYPKEFEKMDKRLLKEIILLHIKNKKDE